MGPEDSIIISDADRAASLVLDRAMHAASQGTFAVGGLIVDNKTGALVHRMHNNVLRPLSSGEVFTWDPTAHGERQLVYWYYEHREALQLPPPSELTVVTSLDPCVMCAGALLTAGFNIGVIAVDDYAGVNYDEKFEFHSLPPSLQGTAKHKFGYYACGHKGDPELYVRSYQGGEHVAFRTGTVSSANLMGCGAIFADSSNMVRRISSEESGLTPDKLKDPSGLPEDSPVKQAFRKVYPRAFMLKTQDARIPGQDILEELKAVAAAGEEGDGNAVGFLDPFGNLILCLPGRERFAPVRTPFMEVTQAYAQTRWELMNAEATRGVASAHLTVPKYGTFLFLHAPDPNTAPGLMTLGAYGSTMEGPIPQVFPTNLQYARGPQAGSLLELTRTIGNLPPLYTDFVQLAIGPSPALAQESLALKSLAQMVSEPVRAAREPRLARHSLVYTHKARNSRG
ncbi:nucleoside deaminase [Nannocystis bainbridge]|uniref:Nucleoside deaminase n=1 Tax=Nannocystis bainbridge TaxID=2995303 RepID=A0ABT5DSC3_9BACT|nr:nucleoside deaminase [Nannocystis bainbridge]MDC0716494.1 nucleoside deaminase [Nannocystis bainbridge]